MFRFELLAGMWWSGGTQCPTRRWMMDCGVSDEFFGHFTHEHERLVVLATPIPLSSSAQHQSPVLICVSDQLTLFAAIWTRSSWLKIWLHAPFWAWAVFQPFLGWTEGFPREILNETWQGCPPRTLTTDQGVIC